MKVNVNVNNVNVNNNVIKKALLEHHYKKMLVDIKKYKKLENISKDNFREVQRYFQDKSIHNTRMAFRIRCP